MGDLLRLMKQNVKSFISDVIHKSHEVSLFFLSKNSSIWIILSQNEGSLKQDELFEFGSKLHCIETLKFKMK